MVYFDNSATTKPSKEVVEAMVDCMENFFANPSSAHGLGLKAEKKLNESRIKVGNLIGADPDEIVFTSGGSEANNMVIRGLLKPSDHVITSTIEHPSVYNTIKSLEKSGVEVTYLDVDRNGIVNLKELSDSIKPNTKLVTIMHVNNEIGSIQPIYDIVDIVKKASKKAKVHFDIVQSAGKVKIDVKKLGVDYLSLSGHKIHGPKGVGALYMRKGLNISPIITGGGQERDLRSGTENIPAICGFGIASEFCTNNLDENIKKVNNLKSYFVERLSEIDGILINSPLDDSHIGNILNVSFDGIRGEVLLHALEDYDIYVSTGSACSAKKSMSKNYVLPAIGLSSNQVQGAIRFSFSYQNTIEEVDLTIDALKKVLPFLRRINK
jgi:cysteine desulfurase